MIHVVYVAVVTIGLFLLFRWYQRHTLRKLVRWTKHHDDRISSLEVKDTVQDERLDQHDQRFHEDERALRMLSKEVGELGKDVGWEDDRRETQVLTLPPDDDNNPV